MDGQVSFTQRKAGPTAAIRVSTPQTSSAPSTKNFVHVSIIPVKHCQGVLTVDSVGCERVGEGTVGQGVIDGGAVVNVGESGGLVVMVVVVCEEAGNGRVVEGQFVSESPVLEHLVFMSRRVTVTNVSLQEEVVSE